MEIINLDNKQFKQTVFIVKLIKSLRVYELFYEENTLLTVDLVDGVEYVFDGHMPLLRLSTLMRDGYLTVIV